jgi:hypothetical protein
VGERVWVATPLGRRMGVVMTVRPSGLVDVAVRWFPADRDRAGFGHPVLRFDNALEPVGAVDLLAELGGGGL